MQIVKSIHKLQNNLYSLPIALLLLCTLAYGLYLPWMGFYWDDWPWVWFSHISGPQAVLKIDSAFRPLAGIVLWIGSLLAGENPLRWQLYNFVIRWLGGVALWWALRQIWPRRGETAAWVTFLFLVYPGFGQQFVAVNSSRHLFPLITFFLSIGFTAKGINSKTCNSLSGMLRDHRRPAPTTNDITCHFELSSIRRLSSPAGFDTLPMVALNRRRTYRNQGCCGFTRNEMCTWMTATAVLLSLVTMLTTEYYYGLELVRVVVLWLLLNTKDGKPLQRLVTTLKAWLPYLVPLVGVFVWRYTISHQVNYQVSLVEEFTATPGQTALHILSTALSDFVEVTLGAWSKLFAFPSPADFGPRKTLMYWGVTVLGALGTFIYTNTERKDPHKGWNIQAVLIGGAALLIGGLPFWVTGLEVKLAFPNDRLTLPMMVGASTLAAGLIDLIIRPRQLKLLILSLVVGLSVGAQFQNAVSYQQDWDYQVAFLQQFTWRVPGLAPGTAILTPELPIDYATDNSLTAPLNWIYAPKYISGMTPYAILYIDLRLGGKLSALEAGAPITIPGGRHPFEGSTDQSIALYHAPPACLRILDPTYDRHLPQTPDEIDAALLFSNLEQIIINPDTPAILPEGIFGPTSTGSWCYYFEKADLARQQGDWERVAEIGDVAFTLEDSPNHASERVPFIEGYARTGDWDTAVGLTMEAIEIDKFMGQMLCDTWKRILQDTLPSEGQTAAIQLVDARLACGFE